MKRPPLVESRPVLKILLASAAVTSYLLYTWGVLALHQDRAPGWALEAQGPIPVAISYLIYRTPLGATDDNVLTKFLHPNTASVQDIIASAANGSIPRGAIDPVSYDGLGAGTNLFATAAMWTFGVRISSLVLFYLTIVGVAVSAFVLRFRDNRLIVVPLYFLVMTILLLTPLCASHLAVNQMPIGGHRYFVLAVFLPALHVFFEITEKINLAKSENRILNPLLLFIQGLLLFGVLVVRTSVSYVLAPLFVALIWRIYRNRKQRDHLIPLVHKSTILAFAFALWATFVVTAIPAYVHTGRVFGVFWHRAFISFALHPDWPFGDLQHVYNCTRYFPKGLNGTTADSIGHCIWFAYPPNATRPVNGADLYGGEYEKILRNAYFDVLIHYPRQALDLYLIVKSKYIKGVLAAASESLFELNRAPVAKSVFTIAIAQLVLFIAFIFSMAIATRAIVIRQLLIIPIFFLISLAPLYVAWAVLWTSADTVFLMYCCLLLAGLLVIEFAIRALVSAAMSPLWPSMSRRILSRHPTESQQRPGLNTSR